MFFSANVGASLAVKIPTVNGCHIVNEPKFLKRLSEVDIPELAQIISNLKNKSSSCTD